MSCKWEVPQALGSHSIIGDDEWGGTSWHGERVRSILDPQHQYGDKLARNRGGGQDKVKGWEAPMGLWSDYKETHQYWNDWRKGGQ